MPKLPKDSSFEDSYQKEHQPNYLIIKGNDIVQNAHYSMPLAHQKVLASLIRSIKPGQKNVTVHFSTKKYVRMLGMRPSGTNFREVMTSLKHISGDNFYLKQPDGTYVLWQWFATNGVVADPRNHGNFSVTFNPQLKQYLFNKSLRYRTIYKFSDIMLMQSRYSPRLYEIFRSNQSRQKVQKRGLNYSLKELHWNLNLLRRNKQTDAIMHDKHGHVKYIYPAYSDFKRRVLLPAQKEINLFTEYNIRMTPRYGKYRKVLGINVVMLHKNKKQLRKRDDRIFFITHHIPKSQWATWREDTIRGKFHRVKPRKRRKEINGKFRVIKPKSDNNFPSKEELKHLDDYLGKHKIPFKEVNLGGDKIEYYSPLLHKYVWTTYYLRDKQMKLYKEQQKIVKQMETSKKKHKGSRSDRGI